MVSDKQDFVWVLLVGIFSTFFLQGCTVISRASLETPVADAFSPVPVLSDTAYNYPSANQQLTVSPLPTSTIVDQDFATPFALEGISQPPDDKYLFVELWVETRGTGELPMVMIDFPRYEYDLTTGTLEILTRGKDVSLTPQDWGFVGQGESRSGAAGGGTSSILTPIRTVPFGTTISVFTGEMGEYAEELRTVPVKILAVNADGHILTEIDNEQIMLGLGESWSNRVKANVKTEQFDGEIVVMSSVTNYGWNERSKIQTK